MRNTRTGLCVDGPLDGQFVELDTDYLEADWPLEGTIAEPSPPPKTTKIHQYEKKHFSLGGHSWYEWH